MVTTIRIPVDIRNPRTQSLAGNSFFDVLGLTNYDLGFWHFLKTVDGKVYAWVEIPKNVVAATPNIKFIITIGANATSGVAVWQVNYAIIADDSASVDVTFTTITAQNITVPGTARQDKKVTFTPAAAATTGGYFVVLEIFHNGASGSETLAVDSELYDVTMEIDVN